MNKAPKKKSGKIAGLSGYFFDRIKISVLLWASLFLFGLFSYTVFMQRQGFPQVDLPVSVVQGVYFAEDKAQVDREVTQPVLSAIEELDEVKTTTANSGDNNATIVVEYQDNITSQQGSDLVKSKVEAIKADLPKTAQIDYQAIDATRFNNKYDILLSVSGDEPLNQLVDHAEQATEQLRSKVPDATKIEVVSPFEEAINPATGEPVTRQTRFDWYGKRIDGEFVTQKSVVIGVTLKDDQDVIAFDNQLTEVVDEINNSAEFQDVEISVAAGFAEGVRQQISSLQGNLFAGLIIVVIVCMIFIGWRAGILAAIGMTVTLTTAVGLLFLFGISLNTISLFALVLCLGLIVDDTIIIVEALDAQSEKTKNLRDAVRASVNKIALASAAGTFTTVLGFAPLLFVSGILGEFIRLMPITIIVVLLVSLIMSLLFIPFMSRFFLAAGKQSKKGKLGFIRSFETWLGNTLAGFITGANTRKKKITRSLVAVVLSLVFILGTGPLFQQLKFDIFPTVDDSNSIRIELSFAPTVTLDQAQQITEQANQQIKEVLSSNVESISYLGGANNRQATANVTLIPYQERDTTARQLVQNLEQGIELQNTKIVVNQIGAGPPKEQYPFKVQIESDNPGKADKVAQNLISFLEGREIARENGTTAAIDEVNYNGEQATITRVDGQRIVEVSASFTADDVSALVQATQTEVEQEFLNNIDNLQGLSRDAVTFDFGSETDNQESFQSVLIALPILVLAMFILLAVQFKSIFQPLLILVAVPFSFFGVALALLITNNPLSFFVMVAFFALIGISVNNSILLTDYANQNRRASMSPRFAVADALKSRTRPLITTSITSVLALLPLALSDPFWESLAVTLIGGLTASAVLVLISFPYYYLGLEALRSRAKVKWQNRRS